MDLENARITLEEPAWPIESAFTEDPSGQGWRAAQAGAQTVWIGFAVPQPIHEVHVRLEATERRGQEFVLLCSNDGSPSYHEIVRQQFNFFSDGASPEDEAYFHHLTGFTGMKLAIFPDISNGNGRATLRALRFR